MKFDFLNERRTIKLNLVKRDSFKRARGIRALIFSLLLGVSLGALAAQRGYQTKAQLHLELEEAKPGDTVTAAVVLAMAPGWHTYWRYGGDSGGPTEIEWELPQGVTAGEIEWPVPEKLVEAGLTTYVYHDEAALLVPLRIGNDTPPGTLTLKAKLSWLECEKVCVMGSGRVSATLKVGTASTPSPNAGRFAPWREKLPKAAAPGQVEAAWEMEATGRKLNIFWSAPPGMSAFDFYPFNLQDFEIKGETTPAEQAAGKLKIVKQASSSESKWPSEILGILAWADASGKRQGLSVVLKPATPATPVTAVSKPPPVTADSTPPRSLYLWMILAVLGGFILNFMPCVLPVIALKVLGFVGHGESPKSETRKLGLLYALGVWVSFLVLAGAVIAVKKAGNAASWGMQLQNPVTVVILATLVTLVALNLFGVFEVTLGGGALGAASKLTAKEGSAGAFFNGVLATALATPCTAPALGAALGFAFTQSAGIIVLIFSCVALGLAAPYVALCWEPAWLKFLPKPGVWMERFKMAMGFPMLATALWLYTLASEFYGDGGDLWFGIFLVLVSMAAWIWGTFVQRGSARRGLSIGITVVVLLMAYWGVLERELKWRSPSPSGNAAAPRKAGGIPWESWSPAAVAKARSEKRPVFVDFTAKWCLTCQVNKKTSIEIDSVKAKLLAINAVALIENSPIKSAEVVAELNRHGRAGVPLVLVYPKDSTKPPIVLPELLTPGLVLDALEQASK